MVKNWYKKSFKHLVNVSIFNVYIIANKTENRTTALKFTEKLVWQFLANIQLLSQQNQVRIVHLSLIHCILLNVIFQNQFHQIQIAAVRNQVKEAGGALYFLSTKCNKNQNISVKNVMSVCEFTCILGITIINKTLRMHLNLNRLLATCLPLLYI